MKKELCNIAGKCAAAALSAVVVAIAGHFVGKIRGHFGGWDIKTTAGNVASSMQSVDLSDKEYRIVEIG